MLINSIQFQQQQQQQLEQESMYVCSVVSIY